MGVGAVAGYNAGWISGVLVDAVPDARPDSANPEADSVGGLVGYNSGLLENAYFAGEVRVTAGVYDPSAVGACVGVNDGTVQGVYYRAPSTLPTAGVGTAADAALLASGEVAYRLGAHFGQNVDNGLANGGAPVLGGARVYRVGTCASFVYSNTEGAYAHAFGADGALSGVCAVCGELSVPEEDGGVLRIGNAGELYWLAQRVNAGMRSARASITADIDLNPAVDFLLDADTGLVTVTRRADGEILAWIGTGISGGEGGNAQFDETPSERFAYYLSENGGYERAADTQDPLATLHAWIPLKEFEGSIQGNGHRIDGLFVRVAAQSGLIALLGEGGSVCDLTVGDALILGTVAAGLAAKNEGSLERVRFSGTVVADLDGGGIAASNGGSIRASVAEGTVLAEEAGGLIGSMESNGRAQLLNSYHTGRVFAAVRGGGIAATVSGVGEGSVRSCYSIGTVAGPETALLGGIAGVCTEYVTESSISRFLDMVQNVAYCTDTFAGSPYGRYTTGEYGSGIAGQQPTDEGYGLAAFENGTVAYRLGDAFGQNIDNGLENEGAPVLGGARVRYGYTTCDVQAEPHPILTNGAVTPTRPAHTPNADDGDCTTPVLCGTCGETVVEKRHEHFASDDGDCTTAAICSYCETAVIPAETAHDFAPATTEAPKTCTRCGKTEGEKLPLPSEGGEVPPDGEENTPGGEENTPGGEENTPGGEENTPGGEENTPGGEDNTPGGEENTPDGGNETPDGEKAPDGEEAPDEPLPTGAVVAIVAGSTVAVGGGAWALWWFVFRGRWRRPRRPV